MNLSLPTAAIIFVAVLTAQASGLQQANKESSQHLVFEVATIKPSNRNSGQPQFMGIQIDPGGRLRIGSMTLKGLIEGAYHISFWQIQGGEPWMSKDEFNIEAKPPDNLQASITDLRHTWTQIEDEHLRRMLQAFLAERFRLRVHHETAEGKVFWLQRSNKPLQIKLVRPPVQGVKMNNSGSGSVGWAGTWAMGNTSMPQLANFASNYLLHRPVIDKTALEGSFDYRSREEPTANNDDSLGTFTAFVQEMGLELKLARGPVESIVIDHAEQPSGN